MGVRLPRPGRRATWVARGAAVGTGGFGALGAVGYALLWTEARLARRTVKPPETGSPVPPTEYPAQDSAAASDPARTARPPLRLALLGDSSATGMGCSTPEETPGARLARGLAEYGRSVHLDVAAVVGSKSRDLAPQVSRALLHPPHIAVILVGGNDVTHLVPAADAATDLYIAVARLREAGARVVVGTCPDLGRVRPIAQPLRWIAGLRGRQLAEAQRIAVEAAGGVAVPLGRLLGPSFAADLGLFCEDRFHPSAAGYALVADALLPELARVAGLAPARPAPTRIADDDDRGDPSGLRALPA